MKEAEIQIKMNINWLIENNFIKKLMFVYLFTFILAVWDILWCKTIIFEVKISILHQFTELKASGGYFIPG